MHSLSKKGVPAMEETSLYVLEFSTQNKLILKLKTIMHKLLFSNGLHIEVIVTLNKLTDNEVGPVLRKVSLSIAQNGPGTRIIRVPYTLKRMLRNSTEDNGSSRPG